MKQGFIKVAAVTPKVKVADTVYNREQICAGIEEAAAKGARVLVFPELCISAYTCGDLFLQERLLASCREELLKIAEFTKGKGALVFVGLPMEREGKLYNAAMRGGCSALSRRFLSHLMVNFMRRGISSRETGKRSLFGFMESRFLLGRISF